MKNDRLIPGLILVLIGAAFLLDTLDVIDFHWSNIFRLWPIFLIVGGINLVFANNRTPLATIIKIGVVLLGFGLLLFGNFGGNWWGLPSYTYNFHDHHNKDNNDGDDDDNNDDDDTSAMAKGIVKVSGTSNFNLPYDANAKTAQLHITGGGTEYNLNDTTGSMFKADTKEHFGTYEFSHSNNGSAYTLNFDMNDKKGGHFNWHGDNNSNSVTFKLNPNPVWDIDVNTGATELKFDLTKFKIHKLDLNGGAASFDVTLGEPVADNTSVTVSTGMANVNISIPKNAACKITTDSGLSNNNFDGFTKNGDGDYETPGYDAAKNKIILDISGGLSDFKVHRY